MKRIPVIGALVIIVAVGFFLFFSSNSPIKITTIPTATTQSQQAQDIKAAFAIFTNGTFRVFTAAMYHNLSTDVYIQADNPNIIHIKKSGVTWNDFFKTLPFKLTENCLITGTGETFCSGQDGTLKFYLNGVRNDTLLDKTINPGDRALITFGNEAETQIQGQLDKVTAIN